jgi:hypothetical protein
MEKLMSNFLTLEARYTCVLKSGKMHEFVEKFETEVSPSYFEKKLDKKYRDITTAEFNELYEDYLEQFSEKIDKFIWPDNVTPEQAITLELDYYFGEVAIEPLEIIQVPDTRKKDEFLKFLEEHDEFDGWKLEWSCW